MRLVHSDEYLCLLRARQLILNVETTAKPLLVPALIGASALLSGIDPLHVVRALAAIMPLLVTLAIGRVAFLLTHSLLASSVAMYCQNLSLVKLVVLPLVVRYAGPQPELVDLITLYFPHSLESEAALFFLLVWMAILLAKQRTEHSVNRSTVACGIVLLASSPLLLLVAPFAGLACMSRRPRVFLPLGMLVAVLGGVAWQMWNPGTPVEALQYLPCMLSLLIRRSCRQSGGGRCFLRRS